MTGPTRGRLRLGPAALLVAACASAACATLLATRGAPRDRLRFSHQTHGRAKVECLACHEAAYDATDLTQRLLPDEAKCLECHREEKAQGRCAFCHEAATAPASYAPRPVRLSMSHAAHIELTEERCERCHAALPEPGRPAPAPAMAACLSCHEHRAEYDEGRCGGCHRDLARYPLEPLSAFSHQGDFTRRHGASARSSAEVCVQCHEQTFCADCHAQTAATPIELRLPEQVTRGFIHRDDFVSRHALDAKADAASCRRCHGSAFCEACHADNALVPGAPDPRDPHPPGWALPGAGTRFHGTAARRDIASCAPCHDQGAASICVGCHRVGGIGGDPHTSAFRSRHDLAEAASNGMCLACHR